MLAVIYAIDEIKYLRTLEMMKLDFLVVKISFPNPLFGEH